MFAQSVDRTEAGQIDPVTIHGSMRISELMTDAINFAAFDAG